mmetsp:Transcript_27721/g.71333  ORF Transcript_27721/g.71333 Transcript_27721/m.71333 type:complete len:329 (-) Transcript_27721:393-1379(-)
MAAARGEMQGVSPAFREISTGTLRTRQGRRRCSHIGATAKACKEAGDIGTSSPRGACSKGWVSRRGILQSASVVALNLGPPTAPALGRASKGSAEAGSALQGVTLLVESAREAAKFYVQAFGMEQLPSPAGADIAAVEAGGVVLMLQEGATTSTSAGEASLRSLGIAVPNAAAARAAAIAAGAKSGGDGLCSGDHLEGCTVRGPGDVPLKMLKDSKMIKGQGRLCRVSLNTANVEAAAAFYESNMGLQRVKKQLGVVDRLAQDRPPPPGLTLLSFGAQPPSFALELCPVFAVQRGQSALADLNVRRLGAIGEGKGRITDPDGRIVSIS